MTKLVVLASLLLAVVATTAAARPDEAAQQAPGVSSTTVLLGGTAPLSGPAAAFAGVAHGANAYFRYANARGGVHGRRIVYKIVDDAYEPARTVQATRELVQRDRVFAIFNSFGTENALAVRAFLNQLEVPHLFLGTGVSDIGEGHRRYPWSIGYVPSFVGEGAIYGRNIARTRPRARIAVLYEDSPYGKDLLRGVRRGLAGKGRVVATQSHAPTDPNASSQVASLRASRADVLMLLTTPVFVIQGFIQLNKLGWRPQVYISSASVEPTIMRTATLSAGRRATEGAISMAFLKDVSNPRWARDRGARLYKQIMRRYYPQGRVTDLYNLYGMAVAFTMVDTLRRAGRNLTRDRLLHAATHLNERNNPFLLPGVAVRTSPTSYYPITKAQLYRYRRGTWQPVSGLLGARG